MDPAAYKQMTSSFKVNLKPKPPRSTQSQPATSQIRTQARSNNARPVLAPPAPDEMDVDISIPIGASNRDVKMNWTVYTGNKTVAGDGGNEVEKRSERERYGGPGEITRPSMDAPLEKPYWADFQVLKTVGRVKGTRWVCLDSYLIR